MREGVHVKQYPVSDLAFKLDLSKRGAEKPIKRSIHCPNCGFYLLDVYGTEHYYTKVKCQKCKFCEVIDTALFRTILTKQNRNNPRMEGLTDEDLYSYLSGMQSR